MPIFFVLFLSLFWCHAIHMDFGHVTRWFWGVVIKAWSVYILRRYCLLSVTVGCSMISSSHWCNISVDVFVSPWVWCNDLQRSFQRFVVYCKMPAMTRSDHLGGIEDAGNVCLSNVFGPVPTSLTSNLATYWYILL